MATSCEDAKTRRNLGPGLLVDGQLIIELKSVATLHPIHPKQFLTHLRLINKPVGLLINFGAPLLKDGLRRVDNQHHNFASLPLCVHQSPEAGE